MVPYTGSPHDGPEKLTALTILDYMHAPAVAFYFLGAVTFSACTLQKPNPTFAQWKRRRFTITVLALLVASYIAQAIYYLSRVLADHNWSAPKHTVIHALGSILVWSALDVALSVSNAPVWNPYFGSFVLQSIFEISILSLTAKPLATRDRFDGVPLAPGAFRLLICTGLLADSLLIALRPRKEKDSDEEGQSLLGKPANGAAQPNGTADYGATNQTSDDEEQGEQEPEDRDKEIKEKQRKRLEEEGGWLGYLKGFAIFLPYLWPKDNWKLQLCLLVRAIDVIQHRILNVLTPREIGFITDALATSNPTMPWRHIGLWTLYSWLSSGAGFSFFTSFATFFIRNYSYKRISDLAFTHVMRLSMDFHTSKDSGEVLKSVDQAYSLNELVEMVLFDISPVLLDLIVALFYVTKLFDIYMAFIVLSMGGLYFVLGIASTHWTQPKRRVYTEKSRNENKTLYESVSNWQTVAYFNRAPYERNRYKEAVSGSVSAQLAYLFRSMAGYAAQSYVLTFGFAGACVLAISQIVAGKKPVGNLVTLMLYWDTMMNPLYTLAWSYRHLASTLIDAERLLQLLNTQPSVDDMENAKDLTLSSTKVEFKDVDFAYDERKPVLKGISFVAEPGQTIAFVGETGGGKSTMLKLLNRFYDVTAGSVTIDGQDVRSVTQSSLRDVLGIVPQDPALFNQTILENVRYARLDATDGEIQEACKAAAVHDKIMTFPDGYKSKVGERGVKLSGGELQRVAIARVLLKNPKIVMLDEATSAVDSSTEAQIQEAFKRLSAGRTTFVVAHRLSTIIEAHIILVVDHGEIIERGTHAELLKKQGKYFELWSKQTAGTASKANSIADNDKDKTPELLIDITPPEDANPESATSTARDEEDGTKNRKP